MAKCHPLCAVWLGNKRQKSKGKRQKRIIIPLAVTCIPSTICVKSLHLYRMQAPPPFFHERRADKQEESFRIVIAKSRKTSRSYSCLDERGPAARPRLSFPREHFRAWVDNTPGFLVLRTDKAQHNHV